MPYNRLLDVASGIGSLATAVRAQYMRVALPKELKQGHRPNTPDSLEPGDVYVSVPYFSQRHHHGCSVAALKMVLEYWEHPLAQSIELRSTPRFGPSRQRHHFFGGSIVEAAQAVGLSSKSFEDLDPLAGFWTTDFLAFALQCAGGPLVCSFRKNRICGHAAVIVGVSRSQHVVRLHDPATGPNIIWKTGPFNEAVNRIRMFAVATRSHN